MAGKPHKSKSFIQATHRSLSIWRTRYGESVLYCYRCNKKIKEGDGAVRVGQKLYHKKCYEGMYLDF